ncbi:hypothetical protein EIP91_001417 [Steccherinum ochraceum]|uniref:Uncharacterized protein n=1 Tax=Steccherinum ochraceum TaxID=92696 RepID=A0A4R0RRA4_9APHY|nr:hypothetical protein EIP91_001417 [Steccherinum ochraceum]
MAPGISIIPPIWQSNGSFPVVAGSFLPPSILQQARATEVLLAQRSECTDSVVIELTTTVTINHFRRYYDGPIDTFTPEYVALSDGSLVNPPLLDDIKAASLKFAVLAGLFVFFVLNTFTATRYLYRGQVKNKMLFYLLLFSQTFGVAAMVTMIVPFLSPSANCETVAIASRVLVITSYAMLMTGILGFKAYRCLNNSWFVAVVLITLRIAIFTVLALDLSRLRSDRRLSIGCVVKSEPTFLPILVTIQFVEALFICGCFMSASWKASRRPVDHGRLSIQPTLDLKSLSARASGVASEHQTRRGWWDYEPPQPPKGTSRFPPQCRSAVHGLLGTMGFGRPIAIPSPKVNKESGGTVQLPVEPPRLIVTGAVANTSHRTSVVSRISKYMPRMALFKKLVQDELLHTALITVLLLATAVLMLVGTTCRVILEPPVWIAFNWAIAAILTMHSFERVIRRHEQEAILQHPSTWDPVFKAELEASKALRQDRARRAASTIPTVPPTPRRLGWSHEPSVRIRSTASIVLPSNPETPLPAVIKHMPSPSFPIPASPALSERPSIASSTEHTTNRYHSTHVSVQASLSSPTPSVYNESLDSPSTSESHFVPRISVSSEAEKASWNFSGP